jgi:quercetin dioxygenase-like cupin family protein
LAGPFIVHLSYPSGHTVGPPKHPSTEHATMLSGTFFVGFGGVYDPAKFKAVRPGEVIVVPAGTAHFVAVHEQTVVEVRADAPWRIEYVLDADDPRPQVKP